MTKMFAYKPENRLKVGDIANHPYMKGTARSELDMF